MILRKIVHILLVSILEEGNRSQLNSGIIGLLKTKQINPHFAICEMQNNNMKISFDLDDLLIAGIKKFENEPKNVLHKIFRTELLRLGTSDLFEKLKAKGHKTCIYTTSLRSPFKIWLTFKIYGIVLDGIYNKISHDRRINEYGKTCSKYPPMFGIDIHVDDSEGVKMEAERNDFKVIIINENDSNWCERVLAEIDNDH